MEGYIMTDHLLHQMIIPNKLREIENKYDVDIIYAVESGSRAWGFPSPDSDYDVRFIYIRNRKDYIQLYPLKDTINYQLDNIYDIIGWDIKKVLQLFAKGNPTLFEWANSKSAYRTCADWEFIYDVASKYFSEKAACYHYYGMAKSTYCEYLTQEQVTYKKYLYAIRPLLCLKYIEERHCPPPVFIDDLMRDLIHTLSIELLASIRALLEEKRTDKESDLHDHIPLIHHFIETELEVQKRIIKNLPNQPSIDIKPLNELFLKIVDNHS